MSLYEQLKWNRDVKLLSSTSYASPTGHGFPGVGVAPSSGEMGEGFAALFLQRLKKTCCLKEEQAGIDTKYWKRLQRIT